jgi:hypothetical protein
MSGESRKVETNPEAPSLSVVLIAQHLWPLILFVLGSVERNVAITPVK